MAPTRRLRVLGDDEYTTKIVATRIAALVREVESDKRAMRRPSLPEKIELCGPMDMGAAFYVSSQRLGA